MKKEIESFVALWKSDDSPLWILFYGVLMLVFTPFAMLLRMLCSIAIVILGVIKIFKPRKRSGSNNRNENYAKCPECGNVLTYYNHVACDDTEGTCYVKCNCGYDSRYDMEV